jgi:tripartite-type tricarboxylate transporter receptor subunit TctC
VPVENAMPTSRLHVLSAGLLFVLLSMFAQANQNYPTKSVKLIVPFTPGSGSDAIARILAHGLTQSFGQQVVVDNRAGAGGNIAAEMVAKADPDGYSILLANLSHASNGLLYKSLTYDLRRDFVAVTQVVSSPSVLVVHPSFSADTLAKFVRMVKARPGDLAYSSAGIGTPPFIAAELFKDRAGVDLLHVPYRSSAEALNAVLAGEVTVYFAPLAAALRSIKQDKLRALAVTSRTRVPLLPDTPAVAELGYPDYEATDWYGLAVPVNTTAEIIASIRGATLNALQLPQTRTAFRGMGYIRVGNEPDDFSAHIRSEIEKLNRILHEVRTRWRVFGASN